MFLYQHVTEPTHNIDGENPTRLDLIFSRKSEDVGNVDQYPPLGKSHHVTLVFEMMIECDYMQEEEYETYKYNFHKGNYTEIRRELTSYDWILLFEGKTVEEMYRILLTILLELIEKYVPKIKCVQRKRQPKWITREVRDKIRAKERAWKRLRRRKTPRRVEEYRHLRNMTTSVVRQAKKAFIKALCKDIKINPKHFWSFIRSRTTIKDKVLRIRNERGELTKDDKETAEVFNKSFQGVFVTEDKDNVPRLTVNYDGEILQDIEIDIEKVENLLSNININKAMGPDGLHPRCLKECRKELALPVFLIVRRSLDTGAVPILWKIAAVCPIFKKGDKLDPLNYRPVSLTCVLCKICEIIIRERIMKHLEEKELITDSQHGFREKRSTLTNLLIYMEALTDAMDQQIPVDINYLDCRKAFDTVPHERLLRKLEANGIRGKILEWIRAFLSGREQYVEIRGNKSNNLSVTSGVPQGSVLGPVLFLVYINDLVDKLECPVLLFADDAKIYKEIVSVESYQAMQRDLERLEEWSNKWLLKFNPEKCTTMHIGHRNPKYVYQIDNNELRDSSLEKDLGVNVSDDLKPAKHISIVAAKGNRMVGLIKRNFGDLDIESCKTLYCSLVRPHLEYAVQSWAPYYKKDINELEKVQRRMTRLVPELREMEYEERCERLGLTTLEKRRKRGDLIETYKILNGMENLNYRSFFELSELETRTNSRKLKKKGHWRTLIRANTFSVRVVNDWNSLPEEVVTAPNISMFKKRLDQCAWATGT